MTSKENKRQFQYQELLDCSICGEKIEPNVIGWTYGYNSQPVNDGRCCKSCDDYVVMPTRLKK